MLANELALVKRCHDQGMTPRVIAKTSGLSTGQVFNALQELGISKKAVNLAQAFTPWEEAILLGSLLGDGSLRYKRFRKGNPDFRLGHCVKQRDYMVWKVEQLGDLFLDVPCAVKTNTSGNEYVYATSRCTELLVPYYDMFYGNKTKKTITPEILTLVQNHAFMDAVLAIWVGDGGYRTSGNGRSLGICLGGLTEEQYNYVRDWFSRLGYEGVLHKHMGRDTYRYLLFRVRSAHALRDAIIPYTHPSMQYKLDLGPSRTIRRSR